MPGLLFYVPHCFPVLAHLGSSLPTIATICHSNAETAATQTTAKELKRMGGTWRPTQLLF